MTGSAGSLKTSAPSSQKQVTGSKLKIFCDENAAPGTMQPTNEWKSLPTRTVGNKENDKKPGTWNGAKVCLSVCLMILKAYKICMVYLYL